MNSIKIRFNVTYQQSYLPKETSRKKRVRVMEKERDFTMSAPDEEVFPAAGIVKSNSGGKNYVYRYDTGAEKFFISLSEMRGWTTKEEAEKYLQARVDGLLSEFVREPDEPFVEGESKVTDDTFFDSISAVKQLLKEFRFYEDQLWTVSKEPVYARYGRTIRVENRSLSDTSCYSALNRKEAEDAAKREAELYHKEYQGPDEQIVVLRPEFFTDTGKLCRVQINLSLDIPVDVRAHSEEEARRKAAEQIKKMPVGELSRLLSDYFASADAEDDEDTAEGIGVEAGDIGAVVTDPFGKKAF